MSHHHYDHKNLWGMMGMLWLMAAAEEEEEAERKKEEEAKAALEKAKADFTLKAKELDEFTHAEVEAHQKSKAKGLDAEARKAAEAEFKLAEENSKAAQKLAEDAKKAVEKLEGKVPTKRQLSKHGVQRFDKKTGDLRCKP